MLGIFVSGFMLIVVIVLLCVNGGVLWFVGVYVMLFVFLLIVFVWVIEKCGGMVVVVVCVM